MRSHKYTLYDYLALVWHRVNAFKHRIVGTMDRRGMTYVVEIGLAERACAHVARLWNLMQRVVQARSA